MKFFWLIMSIACNIAAIWSSFKGETQLAILWLIAANTYSLLESTK